MSKFKTEHYKAARDHLNVPLSDAKEVVDRCYASRDMEPERVSFAQAQSKFDFESDYEEAWDAIQDERERRREERLDRKMDEKNRTLDAEVLVHLTDGTTEKDTLGISVARLIERAGLEWAGDNTQYAKPRYTFGNVYGESILECSHTFLDGTGIGHHEQEDIRFVELRPKL